MNDNDKKALLVFGSAFALFFLFGSKKKTDSLNLNSDDSVPAPDKREKVSIPKMNPKDASKNGKSKDALISLKAYISAYNNKEPQSALDELNREIAKDMGLKVYRRASDGKFIVTDLQGKEIMSNA